MPTFDSSSSLSSRYVGVLTNSGGLFSFSDLVPYLERITDQYACFRHRFSSLTTFTISPPSLFSLSSKADLSMITYPPRLIQICERKRDGSSTSNVSLPDGRWTEYRLLLSALFTLAMVCPCSNTVGGEDVSAAVASKFLFGRPI